MSPIFSELLNPELKHSRNERYDGINEVLVITNKDYELKVTPIYIKLDSVKFSTRTIDGFNGLALSRKLICTLDYHIFISGNIEEINGITRDDVIKVLQYYRSLG